METLINVDARASGIVIRVTGSIDMNSFHELVEKLEKIFESGTTTRIAFDMSHVDRIDTSGIGLMLRTGSRLREKGGDLSLFGLQGSKKKLFEVAKLNQRLKVCETEDEALNPA